MTPRPPAPPSRRTARGSAWLDGALAAALALLPAAMLAPVWFAPLGAGEDDLVYYWPLRTLVGEALRAGRWPIATPLEAAGAPILADPQSAVLYPPTWLFAACDSLRAYALNVWLAFAVAGTGTFLYLRTLRLGRSAACLGALAFAFGGFLVGHRVHLAMAHTSAWLPWALLGIERLRAGARRGLPVGGMLLLTPVTYLAVTSGHWGIGLQGGLWVAVYALARARPWRRAIPAGGLAAAVGVACAWPGVAASLGVLARSTRASIGYLTVGENSYSPAALVLWLFPLLMGNRVPNALVPHRWWGPWHQCEMLGYVGLAPLAAAAVGGWVLARPGRRRRWLGTLPRASVRRRWYLLGPVATLWAWIALGAAVWALGYHLPTFRLVHAVPVLGKVRCPARMLVVIDLALATLAAMTLQAARDEARAGGDALGRMLRRAAVRVLPVVMLAVLATTAAVAGLVAMLWPWPIGGSFAGSRWDALASVLPWRSGVWLAGCAWALTAAGATWWARAPRRRGWVWPAVAVADLAVLTLTVDVPPDPARAPDPRRSPVAAWLRSREPDPLAYRVLGLGTHYHDRPEELLLPKTAAALGVPTIANYGPWQSPDHAHLLGFDQYGQNHQWRRLVRSNHLLSLYGVKYLIAADPAIREAIEAVRSAKAGQANGPPPSGQQGASIPPGDLLVGPWRVDGREVEADTFRLAPGWASIRAQAWRRAPVAGGRRVRLSLELRGLGGPASSAVWAQLVWKGKGLWRDGPGVTVDPARTGADWRRFAGTFVVPEDVDPDLGWVRVYTFARRGVEVRRVSLVEADPPRAPDPLGRLTPGSRAYRLVAEIAPVRLGDSPVAIYENLLAMPVRRDGPEATPAMIEALRWRPDRACWRVEVAPPDVSMEGETDPAWSLWRISLPAAALYLVACASAACRRGLRAAGGSGR